MSTQPSSPVPALLKEAAACEQASRPAEAERLYRLALAQQPQRADANQRYLDLLMRSGRHSDALALATSLTQSEPKAGWAWTRVAQIQLTAGIDALAACEAASRLSRDSAEAHEYLGVALRRAGRLAESVAALRKALKLAPGAVGARVNLANVLKDLGERAEAMALYRAAIKAQPSLVAARYNLALTLIAGGAFDEAKQHLQACIEQQPGLAEAHNALGLVFKERLDYERAEEAIRAALALSPALAEANFNLATLLVDKGERAAADASYVAALATQPDNARFRAARLLACLPIVPTNAAEADAAATAFDAAVADYAAWRDAAPAITDDSLSTLPFLLAYRAGNHRDALARFADATSPRIAEPTPPATLRGPRTRVRVGIVSRHVRRHSVWDVVVRGIVTQLDADRFELAIYHLGVDEDAETAVARRHARLWRDAATIAGETGWAQAIAADACDVLIYPEIGMDPLTYALARRRLAPRQLASWGHPITTGLSTIDGFLSGELLEPPDAQAHYRERLHLLPGTGCFTSPMSLAPGSPPAFLAELQRRPGPLLLAPQMPFKFDPSDDGLLVDIAQQLGDCTIAFARDPKAGAATDKLMARLGAAFRARGLDPERHLFVGPWLQQAAFEHLLDAADAALDCPAFSGYTTALMALRRGTPVVTLEGPSLRQRLAAGLLRRVGMTETIATDRDAYVRIAVQLARERDHAVTRQARRDRLRESAPAADGDVAVIRALEGILASAD